MDASGLPTVGPLVALMRSMFYAGFSAALATNDEIAKMPVDDAVASLAGLHRECMTYAAMQMPAASRSVN
jgi:hypothetical protein